MAASARDLLLPMVLLALLVAPSVVHCGSHHRRRQRRHQDAVLGWVGGGSAGECGGTVAECIAGGGGGGGAEFDEFEMSSEVSRRILATTRYISYNALRRDSTPCSRRGASYYNCRPGAQANPYSRGCSAITRCRS